MATRVFRCGKCGHKLRFGVSRCGYCLAHTPILNRRSTYEVLAVVVVALIVLAIVL